MGQKSAAYDASGAIIGFYDSVDSPMPPSVSAIEISDEQWQQCLLNPGWTVQSDHLVAPVVPTEAQLASSTKASKLAEINAAAQSDVSPYSSPYPKFEIDSWPQQAQEAAAYTADNTVATPWCDLAASKRGIDRVAFIQKVQAKAQAFIQISATVAGYRQSLEDQLDAIDLTASDALTQIEAITYTSPLGIA